MKKRLAPLQPVRLSMMLAGALYLSAALGQSSSELQYHIHFTTAITPFQEKFVHEGLRSQDPGIAVVFEPQAHRVLVSTIAHLDRNELQSAISPSGLVIDNMGPLHYEAPSERHATGTSVDTYPSYRNTGDPIRDNERYGLLKNAWIEQHRQEYEQLKGGSPDQEQ